MAKFNYKLHRKGTAGCIGREFFDIHSLPNIGAEGTTTVIVFPIWDTTKLKVKGNVTIIDTSTGKEIEVLDSAIHYPDKGETDQPVTVTISVAKVPTGNTIEVGIE